MKIPKKCKHKFSGEYKPKPLTPKQIQMRDAFVQYQADLTAEMQADDTDYPSDMNSPEWMPIYIEMEMLLNHQLRKPSVLNQMRGYTNSMRKKRESNDLDTELKLELIKQQEQNNETNKKAGNK